MNFGWTWREGWGARRGELRGYVLGRAGPPTVAIDTVLSPGQTLSVPVNLPLSALTWMGLWSSRPVTVSRGTPATNEVITLSVVGGTPTGGQVTLKWAAGNSGLINYDATAAQVQAGLEAASWIAPGDVVCTGGPWPGTPVVATFQGALAGVDVADDTPPHIYTMLWTTGTVDIVETVKGAAGTSADTVTLRNAVPLVWWAGSPWPCPFTADVSNLTITNPAAGLTARVRLAFDTGS